jgi:integrase
MAKPKRQVVIRFREGRGKWEVDYVDVAGRRHRPMFDTEAQAHEEAGKAAERLNSKLPLDPDAGISIAAYVERFLKGQAHLSQRTLSGYRAHLTGIVTERLGRLSLRDLRRRHVNDFMAGLREETYTRSAAKDAVKRPYAADTIRLIRAALSALCSAAVEDEILTANPCLGGRRGRRAGSMTKAQRLAHIRPLSEQDRDRVLAHAGELRALYETMAKAGLRPGEAYAARVDDLDLDKRTLLVERALNLDGTVKETKTGGSRVVRLTASLVRTLRAHLTRLKAKALKRGWGQPTWLFPTDANEPQDYTQVAKTLKRVLTAAGVSRHHRPYDLRHTYASLMLAKGAPLTFVSHQLGHANPGTTLRHYARWIPGEGAEFADLLEPHSGTTGLSEEVAVGETVNDSSGAGGGSRTRDLLITNQLLCH